MFIVATKSAEVRIVVPALAGVEGQCFARPTTSGDPDHPLRGQCPGAARRASGDFGGFVLALQALAAALHGRDELREVDLERVEDVVGVVLGAEADLALARAGVLDDLLGGAL